MATTAAEEAPAGSGGTFDVPTTIASKRVVYVGGLAKDVTIPLLRAAMIPFGDIKSVDIVSELYCENQ